MLMIETYTYMHFFAHIICIRVASTRCVHESCVLPKKLPYTNIRMKAWRSSLILSEHTEGKNHDLRRLK